MNFFFISLKECIVINIHRLASNARVDFEFFIPGSIIRVLKTSLEGTISRSLERVDPLLALFFVLTLKTIDLLSSDKMELFGVTSAKVYRASLLKIDTIICLT